MAQLDGLAPPRSKLGRGGPDGEEVRKKSIAESEEGDARTETWHAAERSIREEGDQPEAGDCHRFVGSPARRRQGAPQEVQDVFIVSEALFLEEALRRTDMSC
jgi:hypothetical protein